jgi:hypothetical protein
VTDARSGSVFIPPFLVLVTSRSLEFDGIEQWAEAGG